MPGVVTASSQALASALSTVPSLSFLVFTIFLAVSRALDRKWRAGSILKNPESIIVRSALQFLPRELSFVTVSKPKEIRRDILIVHISESIPH